MHFDLVFQDGTTWQSPNIFDKDPGWASMISEVSKGIHGMIIPIAKDKVIIMQGFEKYNFFVEVLQNLNGSGKTKIQAFYFCAAYQGKVLSYQINPLLKKITKRINKEGEEYAGSATRGWGQGIIGIKPKEGICQL